MVEAARLRRAVPPARLGSGLINGGLAAVLKQNGFGGPGIGRPVNPFTGAVTPGMPGVDALADVLPFAELAVGVGLIFGIFTTICAIAACVLALVTPLMMTVSLMVNAGIATAPNRFGFGVEFFLLGIGQSTLAYAALLLLSPVAINRLSMDALIFARLVPADLPCSS